MMNSVFEVRGKVFAGGTHVMGILNVTPDSFFPLSRVGDDVAERALEAKLVEFILGKAKTTEETLAFDQLMGNEAAQA